MIKEKHDKGSDTSSTAIKDEPASTDNLLNKSIDDTRIKSEDDNASSSCASAGGVTKNGAPNIIGSTNTGSIHNMPDRKEPLLMDNVPEEGVQQENSNLLPSLKTEENLESTKLPQDAFSNLGGGVPAPSVGGVPRTIPPPPDGVQPLASNIINKQPSSVEVQYMQQQSQIFVFSTQLANKGAEAVFQGHYPSIIAYHCAQPGTKKYLEKNPLKVTQFNRQNPAQWLNNLAMMKNKGCTRSPNVGKGTPNIDGFLVSDSLDDMVNLPDSVDLPWDQKTNMVNIENINNGVLPEVESSCQMRSSPGANIPLGHSPIMTSASSASPSLSNMQPSLQGVKVPDENLTPQQRQHREEQLATIRKMQQMLFPEHTSLGMTPEGHLHPVDGQDPSNPGMGPGPNIDMPNEMTSDGMPPGGPNGPNMMPTTQMGPNMMPQRPMNMPMPPGNLANMPPSAQMEWQKLQQQFFDERKGRGQTNMVPCHNTPSMVSRVGPGNPGARLQGPPPPYHQTPRSASVPIALQSPSPASPNNPTSNLSLPSPRASSALNSPADTGRSFNLNRHINTGQSPTSQDSPSTSRGLIPSNPSTPISSHLSPNSNLIGNTSQEYPPTSGLTPTSSSDGMFGRTLQSLAQQKQNLSTSVSSANTTTTLPNKEPNLMPVPSPQQIQYLNTFEGQELTIQKQPNTSLKDGSIISPTLISTTIESGFSGVNTDSSKLSGPNTPLTPSSLDIAPRFPSNNPASTEGCRFQMSSPQATTNTNATTPNNDKTTRTASNSCLSPSSRTTSCSNEMHKSDITSTFAQSPHSMMDIPRFPGSSSGPPSTSPGPFSSQQQQAPNKMGNFASISTGNKGPGSAPPNAQSQPTSMSQSQQASTGPMDMPGLPPSSNYGCSVRSDNVPLNPNSTSSMSGNPKVSHFDPISSLAQMSQQLTNSVASNLNGQGQNQPSGMMNFTSSMHMGVMDPLCHIPEMEGNPASCNMMMQMHGPNHPHQYHPGNPSGGSPMGGVRSLSPKMGPGGGPPGGVYGPSGPMPIPPRMMGRLPGCNPYNGANIQVKPSAPNTIQYLPAKPQMTNHGNPPRGPPSLDFLQRFANPMMNSMDGKMPPNQGIPGYFGPGGGGPPNNGHMSGGPPPHHHMGDGPPPMGGGNGGMPGDGPPVMGGIPGPGIMNGGMVPPPGPQGMGPGMPGGPGGGMMGPQGPMGGPPMGMGPIVRGGMRPPGGMNMMQVRMPQMGFNGPANGGMPPGDVGMFPPNQPPGMYVSGPKSSPMGGMGQPDASQPLPPSIGQSSTFKNSPFVGPTTTDPNYAQQFHNFQQQLYATTTRSQLNSGGMGPGGPGGPGPPPQAHQQQQPYFVPK